jgi:hypothetical protein
MQGGLYYTLEIQKHPQAMFLYLLLAGIHLCDINCLNCHVGRLTRSLTKYLTSYSQGSTQTWMISAVT